MDPFVPNGTVRFLLEYFVQDKDKRKRSSDILVHPAESNVADENTAAVCLRSIITVGVFGAVSLAVARQRAGG